MQVEELFEGAQEQLREMMKARGQPGHPGQEQVPGLCSPGAHHTGITFQSPPSPGNSFNSSLKSVRHNGRGFSSEAPGVPTPGDLSTHSNRF